MTWIDETVAAMLADAAALAAHIADVANPHAVTKTQVGLANVTNDAQLKRSAGDFASFTDKAAPDFADVILIEDSAAGGAKKDILLGRICSTPDPRRVCVAQEFLLSGNLAYAYPWLGAATGVGTPAAGNGNVDHPGVMSFRSHASTANSGYRISTSSCAIELTGGETATFIF
jgi:hypothetical protein